MISERLQQVILRELGLESFDLQDATLASQVPGWDSLNHVRVMAAIEDEYKIRFRALEILPLKNLGQLQALVDRKMAGRK